MGTRGETPLFGLYSTVEHLNDLCPDMMVDMETRASRLVILAGPSRVGKSLLEKALSRFHPQLRQNLKTHVTLGLPCHSIS